MVEIFKHKATYTDYDTRDLNFVTPTVSSIGTVSSSIPIPNGNSGAGASAGLENFLYRYNGKEQVQDLNLGFYEYGFSWYDAQIAKFVQVDPLADDYSYRSTYDYAENRPISGVDLNGLEYYYAADGIFLGNGTVEPKNNSVHLVTEYKYNSETKTNIISGSREVWNKHYDFIKLAGTAIAERFYGKWSINRKRN